MEKEFVPHEEALSLKELGFNEVCLGAFNDLKKLQIIPISFQSNMTGFCLAPLYQQAFRWFRDFHKIDRQITSWTERGNVAYYYSSEQLGKPSKFKCGEYSSLNYEEAQLACLKKLIQIVKNK